MDRIGQKFRSFEEATRAERESNWRMTPEQRLKIARELRLRVWGENAPDVREAERSKQ